ncbi:MAG: LysR family transcriptional regulator [Chloroflexi bacterium]|nr:LysR family transcriptional regulator [Chloroflexota bacterium]
MDLRHLQTLCAVIDSGGFTRAAERLYLTQSAVSFQIRQLEEALGTTLFDRSAGGVRPTQSGEVLYRYARKLLLLAAEARDEISALESARQGRVRIGATDVCALFLPEVLRRFGQHHDSVEIAVFEGPAAQVIERVQAGQSDVGIVPHLDDVSGITFTPLLELQLLAICEPHHAFSQLEVITAAELAAQPLALYEQGSVYRQVVERACASIGVRPRIVFESNWLTSILRAVEAGLGVTVLPVQSVREQVASGRLLTRPLAGMDSRLPVAVAARSREAFSGPTRDLIALLLEQTQRPDVHLVH